MGGGGLKISKFRKKNFFRTFIEPPQNFQIKNIYTYTPGDLNTFTFFQNINQQEPGIFFGLDFANLLRIL